MQNLELLAPAGDIDKLKTAIDYGADAVFLAGKEYGLRTASKNFSDEELKEAVDYAHSKGKKVYITMNIIAHNNDFTEVDEYIKYLDKIAIDGVIVADPGIFMRIKTLAPRIELHISTQANITNAETVNFWYELGARRVVLARELSLEEIRYIRQNIPEDMELEVFVHGAMCISYSGRCLLSNYMTNRDANHGDCAQSCRWKYNLVEEKRPGEYYPIEEDERGTFIFNSKDLCLLENIGDLIDAGVNSFKIEGRVKTQYYVATVIRSYRLAIDAYLENRFTDDYKAYLLEEIKKASHRDFTKGFLNGKPGPEGQNYETSSYVRGYDFIAQILDYDEESKTALVEQRNKFSLGDKVEAFGPYEDYHEFTIDKIIDENGQEKESAPHAQELLKININYPARKGDMIRRRVD